MLASMTFFRVPRWLKIALITLAVLLLVAVLGLYVLIKRASCASDPVFPAEVRTAIVDGKRVGWSLSGEAVEGRPTMVLITGLGNSQMTFASVLAGLAEHGQVITYSRLGYCGSDAAPAGPRDAETMAAELHGLLRETGVPGPYVLVGHSLGGLIAEYYAAQYPQDVAGLVFDDARASDFQLRCVATLGADHCADPWWVRYVLLLARPQAREFAALEATETQVRELQVAPRVPALVLSAGILKRGDGDDFLKVWHESQYGLAARYGARQLTFDDSAHFLHTEQPARFIELVGGFYDALPPQAAAAPTP